MLMLGFDFQLESGHKVVNPEDMSRKLNDAQFQTMKKKTEQLLFFKQGVYVPPPPPSLPPSHCTVATHTGVALPNCPPW